jgi:hypothetical protein
MRSLNRNVIDYVSSDLIISIAMCAYRLIESLSNQYLSVNKFVAESYLKYLVTSTEERYRHLKKSQPTYVCYMLIQGIEINLEI